MVEEVDRTPVFTKAQLNALTKEQIISLLTYYQIEYKKSSSKPELVALVPYIAIADPDVPQYSVRIKKIIEANGGKVP